MSLANIRKLLEDDRVHAIAARVSVLAGQSSHFETNAEGHVVVSCLTLNSETPVWANLGSLAGGGGLGFGVWWIPDPGTEVILTFDNGDFEGEAYLSSCHGGNTAPPSGLASGVIFVLGNNVQVRQPNGTAQKLATLADVQAIQSALNGHSHTYVPGTGTATTTTLNPSVPAPTGTTVLEGQ